MHWLTLWPTGWWHASEVVTGAMAAFNKYTIGVICLYVLVWPRRPHWHALHYPLGCYMYRFVCGLSVQCRVVLTAFGQYQEKSLCPHYRVTFWAHSLGGRTALSGALGKMNRARVAGSLGRRQPGAARPAGHRLSTVALSRYWHE